MADAPKQAKKPEPAGETFEGSNGRLYRNTPTGIVEVDDPKRHAQRLLAQSNGYTITGIRLTDPKAPQNGVVVTMSAAEATGIVKALREILEKRV